MSDGSDDRAEVLRMARQHLNSLRAAGVEWLPAASPLSTSKQVREGDVPTEPISPSSAARPEPCPPTFDSLFHPSTATALAVASTEVPLEQRRVELKLLAQEVASCQRCPELASTRTQTVFADGDVGIELCLIGEAPGADEDAQGKPFVGAAGQLLDKILAACGLKREEVYICNTLKCRPPGNRTPAAQELANCHGFLERQLELVQPKFICTLGSSAAQSVLGTTLSLGKLRGRFHDYRGIPVLCTYHPAYLLPHRSPEKKRDVWQDMKLLMERMGRPVK